MGQGVTSYNLEHSSSNPSKSQLVKPNHEDSGTDLVESRWQCKRVARRATMRKMEVEGEESRAGGLRFEIRRQNRKVAHRVMTMITSTWEDRLLQQ